MKSADYTRGPSLARRLAVFAVFYFASSVMSTPMRAQDAQGGGCSNPPCEPNTIPCAQCNGGTYGWYGQFEGATYYVWTNSDNTVEGYVVAPAPPACNFTVTYSLSGSITPIDGGQGFGDNGITYFTWNVFNPIPGGTCVGWTPKTSVTVTGSIANDGCDWIANATWSPTPGSPISEIISKSQNLPASETSMFMSWNYTVPTVAQWQQSVNDTSGTNFNGIQVTERQGFGGTETCEFDGSAFLPYSLEGAGWWIGYYGINNWGLDLVGPGPTTVAYYRLMGRVPCEETVYQAMYTYTKVGGSLNLNSTSYAGGYTGYSLPNASLVTSIRMGETASETY